MTIRRTSKVFKRAALAAALIATGSMSAAWGAIPVLSSVERGLIDVDAKTASMTVNWSAVEAPEGAAVLYIVGYREAGVETAGFQEIAPPVVDTTYTLDFLGQNVNYEFAVSAIVNRARDDWSESLSATTDSDPDADTILTSIECPTFTNCPDTDKDGKENWEDPDDDGDGIDSKVEWPVGTTSPDSDLDTIPNYLEPNHIDTDNDGLKNHLDDDDDGDTAENAELTTANEVGPDPLNPIDTDGDGIFDYLDRDTGDGDNDSDGDGKLDSAECATPPFCTEDEDGDGLTDYLDGVDDRPVDPVTPEAIPDPGALVTGKDGAGGGAFGLAGLISVLGLGLARRRKAASGVARSGMSVSAILLAVLVLSFFSNASVAGETQWYVGAGLGSTTLEPDTDNIAGVDVKDDSSTGGKLFVGYDFSRFWTLEGFVADLGHSELTDGAEVDYELFGISGIYHYPGSLPGFSFLAKAGVANLSNDSSQSYEQENDTQAFVGLGGEYQFDNKFSVRAEYEYFAEDAQMVSLNVLRRFGEIPQPEIKVVEKTIEVPVIPPPEGDGDNDGVVDSKDQCPNTPAGLEVDAHGCEFDLDQDGVLNVDDQCPDTPRGMPVHANGCPKFTGVLEGVHFELDKATLTGNSKVILKKVAQQLNSYPTLKVIVVGHTDSQGSDKYNNKLSLARAKSVAAYLTSQGVRGERMRFAGYGERFPRAGNDTLKGRALNRRVELLPLK